MPSQGINNSKHWTKI